MQHLEEQIAHLSRTVEELSDVIARQDAELSKLRTQVDRLILREAERETDAGGGIVVGDERPPHY
ncbi:MAG: SlyX family protein [Pseudomonadota bacterium]